jgi:hypothetical protein
MIKLKEVQELLQKSLYENPRTVWDFSSTRVASCRAANKNFLDALIATKNAKRPTRSVPNFTGSNSLDVSKIRSSAVELSSTLTALNTFYDNARKYVHTGDYSLATSDDYDTAVENKISYEQVTARVWGNEEFGDSLTLLPSEHFITSLAGPYAVPLPITYTIGTQEVEIPESYSYLRTLPGPFNFPHPYLLEGTIGAVEFSVEIPSGIHTANEISAILDAEGIGNYAEDNVVTVVDVEEVVFSASPACSILGFPSGKTRSNSMFTDCDDVANLLGAQVLRDRQSLVVSISGGKCMIPDCVLVLTQPPYGTYRVRDYEVFSYLGGSVADYDGAAWTIREQLRISRNSAFSITTDSTDPFGIVGSSTFSTTAVKDTFTIRPFVGDVLTGYSDGQKATARITKVSDGSLQINTNVADWTMWHLRGSAQYMCELVLKALPTVKKIESLLNVSEPTNESEWNKYLQDLDEAETLYRGIRPLLTSTTVTGTKNTTATYILSELNQAKYDLAANALTSGELTSFFLLNDITASSAKMLAVYRSSL